MAVPFEVDLSLITDPALRPIAEKAAAGERLSPSDGVTLFRSPDIVGLGHLDGQEKGHGEGGAGRQGRDLPQRRGIRFLGEIEADAGRGHDGGACRIEAGSLELAGQVCGQHRHLAFALDRADADRMFQHRHRFRQCLGGGVGAGRTDAGAEDQGGHRGGAKRSRCSHSKSPCMP